MTAKSKIVRDSKEKPQWSIITTAKNNATVGVNHSVPRTTVASAANRRGSRCYSFPIRHTIYTFDPIRYFEILKEEKTMLDKKAGLIMYSKRLQGAVMLGWSTTHPRSGKMIEEAHDLPKIQAVWKMFRLREDFLIELGALQNRLGVDKRVSLLRARRLAEIVILDQEIA